MHVRLQEHERLVLSTKLLHSAKPLAGLVEDGFLANSSGKETQEETLSIVESMLGHSEAQGGLDGSNLEPAGYRVAPGEMRIHLDQLLTLFLRPEYQRRAGQIAGVKCRSRLHTLAGDFQCCIWLDHDRVAELMPPGCIVWWWPCDASGALDCRRSRTRHRFGSQREQRIAD